MDFLYVIENGVKIGIDGGRIILKDAEENEIMSVPKNTIKGISVFGQSQITTQCLKFCMYNNVHVSYFSQSGRYIGHVLGTDLCNVRRLKQQVFLSEDKCFSQAMAIKIIKAKIRNQLVVANRYLHSDGIGDSRLPFVMKYYRKKLENVESITEIRGYEGMAAREYFKTLSGLVGPEFSFNGRTRRPARDPFNAMLNMGYSLMTKEIEGELENRGIVPYIGFLHEDHEHHPALASDMAEEWRAVIVDSLVMGMIRGHEISLADFEYNNDVCLFTKKGLRLFLKKYEKRLYTESRYLETVKKPLNFRQAIWHQAEAMAQAIDTADISRYMPINIR